jgi:UDP-glucose 4-epimerase
MSRTQSTMLVTGARGFIGRHLCQHLSRMGHAVLGLGHGAWPEADARRYGVTRWLNGDVHASNLRSVTVSAIPDVVYHLAGGSSVAAALANPREDFMRTVAGTVELVEWIRRDAPHARLVAVSSAAVYGATHVGPIAERAAIDPISPYGYHKFMMEGICRAHGRCFGISSVITRPFSVYGPGLAKQLPWDLCTRLGAGERIVTLGGTGHEHRDWTHVLDLVQYLDRLAGVACPEVPTFNVGTGVGTPVADVARWIADAFALQTGCPAAEIHFSGESRPGDPTSLVADVSAGGLVGLRCGRTAQSGLADFVRWFVKDRNSP